MPLPDESAADQPPVAAQPATPAAAAPPPIAPAPPAFDPVLSAAKTFIVMLARALAQAGIPSSRLEITLESVARKLGIPAQFFAMPTGIFASWGDGADQSTHMMRLTMPTTHIERLTLLDEVVADVIDGQTTAEQGTARVMEIVSRPGRYAPWLVYVSFVFSSACAARLFGGGWREILAGAVIGLSTGMIDALATHSRRMARLPEFAAAVCAALIAVLMSLVLAPLNTTTAILAGVVVMLPGMSLTTGISELAGRHVVSGASRVVHALMLLFSMAFGVVIGQRLLSGWLDVPASAASIPLPGWTIVPALLIIPGALMVMFQARPRDWLVMAVAVAVAMASARFGSAALGPELGACLGAVAVGITANAYSRWTNHAAAVIMLPGVIILVPGSLGLRSFSSGLSQSVESGLAGVVSMLAIATGIAVGLLLGHAILPPRRSL